MREQRSEHCVSTNSTTLAKVTHYFRCFEYKVIVLYIIYSTQIIDGLKFYPLYLLILSKDIFLGKVNAIELNARPASAERFDKVPC